jgi:hypothetical protein
MATLMLMAGIVSLSYQLFSRLRESAIDTCSVEVSHGMPYLRLSLASGRKLLLDSTGGPSNKCPPIGTLIEKRRAEWTYRIDRTLSPPVWHDILIPSGAEVVFGTLLLCGVLATRRSS